MLTKEECDGMFGKGGWLPVIRFEHVQPGGKKRPIDDARRYGHNKAVEYTETLDCVSAFQPSLHVREMRRAVKQEARRRRWGRSTGRD